MSAGLPGFGLGGLFFILSALAAPLVEGWQTARGRSSAAAWRQVGRQFAIAVTMIATVDLLLRGVLMVAAAAGGGHGPEGVVVLPLRPIEITTALLLTVLTSAKLMTLAMRARRVPASVLAAAARHAVGMRPQTAWRVLAEGARSD
ncbi:MAG: hypothetical protein ACJ75R_05615 [Solirubrobacterales bacterium]